jgi:hypothetical protein
LGHHSTTLVQFNSVLDHRLNSPEAFKFSIAPLRNAKSANPISTPIPTAIASAEVRRGSVRSIDFLSIALFLFAFQLFSLPEDRRFDTEHLVGMGAGS